MHPYATIQLDLPPVGIKLLHGSFPGLEDIALFQGVSYCQAIFGATFGMELLVKPDSIRVCQWVPIVLGFKEPENDFERSIKEHLSTQTTGIYIAPLHLFQKNIEPDVVIIRTDPENYRAIIACLGWESFIDPSPYQQDVTGLHTFRMNPPRGFSAWAIRNINAWLAALNRFTLWHRFTAFLFRSTWVTKVFDWFISRYMANMSMCRNSTVIPLQTGRANISYFCTGGIAWGKNNPENMTSGFPAGIFKKIEPYLDYPGKLEHDPRLKDLEKIKERLLATADKRGCTLKPTDGR
jgi:hypothetical protein